MDFDWEFFLQGLDPGEPEIIGEIKNWICETYGLNPEDVSSRLVSGYSSIDVLGTVLVKYDHGQLRVRYGPKRWKRIKPASWRTALPESIVYAVLCKN